MLKTRRARSGPGTDPIGALVVAVAALLFGGTVTLSRFVALRDFPPSILAIRFGLAGMVLAGVIVATGQPIRPSAGEGLRIVALGALAYTAQVGLFFLGLGEGTAATATLLFYTNPVWVALLSTAFGKGMPGWTLGGTMVIALSGVAIVVAFSGGLDITTKGIVLCLASAVVFSCYLIAFESFVKRTSLLAAVMWVCFSASASLGAFGMVTGQALLPHRVEEWFALMALGILGAAAVYCLFQGVRRLGAARASIISSLEPFFAALMAFLFLEEALRPGVIGGGALILVGAIGASQVRRLPDGRAGIL